MKREWSGVWDELGVGVGFGVSDEIPMFAYISCRISYKLISAYNVACRAHLHKEIDYHTSHINITYNPLPIPFPPTFLHITNLIPLKLLTINLRNRYKYYVFPLIP